MASSDVKRYRENLQGEIDGVALYRALAQMEARGARAIEVKAEAQDTFNADLREKLARTIWALVHGISSMAITMPLAWEPYGAEAVLDRGFDALMDGYAGS